MNRMVVKNSEGTVLAEATGASFPMGVQVGHELVVESGPRCLRTRVTHVRWVIGESTGIQCDVTVEPIP